ncbi:MAG: hypothetical protein II984_03245 [Clostridia bacterium]|nr:hypothetical protein [Clostridia bacterium]
MLKRIFNNKEYRRKTIELFSLIFSFVFGIFNGTLSIISKSVWFLMLSIYYIALSVGRLGIYYYKKNKEQNRLSSIKLYRNSGLFLLVMNFAIGVAVLQIVFIERGFKYPGLFIYAVATYAFTKITLAIINISKTRGAENYTELSLRSMNLIDAGVSILALQTALLTEFSEPGANFRIANGLTGSAVFIFTLVFGIYMIIKAQKKIKKIKRIDKNGK